MKKVWIRLIAVLMALSCAIILFGCEEEDDSSIRRKKKETTEEYADLEDTVGEAFREETKHNARAEQEETKKNWGQVDEKVEAETTAPLVDAKVDPGSIQLPAVELFDYDYDRLCKLDWFTLQTEKMDDRWILTTELSGATFTFVFKDLISKPIILTVEDFNGTSDIYVTYDIQLGDTAELLPNDVRSAIGPMDGGLYASFTINGYNADLMLDGDMERVDDAVVFLVQIRREG